MPRGCCLPHPNSQKPSVDGADQAPEQQPISATLLNLGFWKDPKDAKAPFPRAGITVSLRHLARFAWWGQGPESCRSFSSSSPQSEACKVTSKETSKSGKIIHYKYTATSKGLFSPPVSCSRNPGLLSPSASPLPGTPRAARGSKSRTSKSG